MKKLIAILIFITVCMHGFAQVAKYTTDGNKIPYYESYIGDDKPILINGETKKGDSGLESRSPFCTLVLSNNQSMEANVTEIWKDVVGYEGYYQVSSLGSIKRVVSVRCKKERILRLETDKDEYLICNLSKDGVINKHKVHRIVAIAFIPNPENKPQVNHKKGIKKDNRHTELEWCTNLENMRHSVDIGLRNTNHLVAYHTGKKKSLHCCAKVVHQYDLNGAFINSYPSVLDAIDATGFRQISACARGEQKTAGGYKWSY